jgi:hypothetical protein
MSVFDKLATFLRFLFVRRTRRAVQEIERLKRMIHMVEATAEIEIACQQAYQLLDQYAELLLRGEDPALLFPQVKQHVEMCMDCQEELTALLDALRFNKA